MLITSVPLLRRRLVSGVLAALFGAFGLAACGGGGSPSSPTPPSPTVSSVSVTGVGSPAVGATVQATATATLSDGTTQVVTGQATWETSNAGVATVTSAGAVTGVAAGEVDIKATYHGTTGSTHVTISGKPPARVALTGTVTDHGNGRPIPGATVAIADGVDAGRSAQTDSNGVYVLGNVAEGRISVTITARDFETVTQAVTVAGDTHQDFALSVNVSALYGTFNVTFSVQQDQCEFPIVPGPQGTLALAGRSDGSQLTATIVERGTTRVYSGTMRGDGSFDSGSSGVIAGVLAGPIVNKHDYTGNLSGKVTGRSVTATESITYGAPCPGKTARFGLSGSR